MGEHTPESIERRFTELLALEEGWLDGGGKAINPGSVERCREFIRVTGAKGFSIFPYEEGHVGLEFARTEEPQGFVCIEFESDGADVLDSVFVLSD